MKTQKNEIMTAATYAAMKKNRKIALLLTMILIMPVLTQITAYADYDAWLTPFSNLVDSMINFMGIIGKALLAWAIFEVATALFSHDTSQMPQALRRIGAGTLLIFIQTIISAMTGSGNASNTSDAASAAFFMSIRYFM